MVVFSALAFSVNTTSRILEMLITCWIIAILTEQIRCSGGVQFAAQVVSNYIYVISKMVLL